MGHYLGMRLFGYRDVKIIFIPFLGAATVGKEARVTAVKRVVTYLLGPAPGIFLGVFLLVFYSSEPGVLRNFAIFLLVLNYVNLLPILPLDGGRVFEVALFSRFRLLKLGFLALSVVVLVVAGVHVGIRCCGFLGAFYHSHCFTR